MPREGRKISSTGFYHIIARGINKEHIFTTEDEKRILLWLLKKYKKDTDIVIYSYCIMSNHFHILLKGFFPEISNYFAKVLKEYATYYNGKYERAGHVFQNRFKNECIETEKYFWNCFHYIHLNPVKANLISVLSSYPYSSAWEHFHSKYYLINENISLFYNKQFPAWADFNEFHNRKIVRLFADVEEDELIFRKEIVAELVEKVRKENELVSTEEIFKIRKLRRETRKLVQDTLKISEKKAEELIRLLETTN